ncbi:MAG: hypothetical protein ABR548_03145 [Actinomycetota bacterium]|nr:hypothetical protein [Actinomycetota bacterium]
MKRFTSYESTELVAVPCDSTAPFLYDNYLPEPGSEPVGEVDGIQVLAPGWLAKLYDGDATLVVDVDEGVLNDSFSLESEYDCRFTLRAPAATTPTTQ